MKRLKKTKRKTNFNLEMIVMKEKIILWELDLPAAKWVFQHKILQMIFSYEIDVYRFRLPSE